MREDGEERARDDVELLARQLVERQPLAEEPAGREAARDGLVHLARVEAAGAGVPGDEEVGDDDVEASVARRQIAAAVVDHEVHVGPRRAGRRSRRRSARAPPSRPRARARRPSCPSTPSAGPALAVMPVARPTKSDAPRVGMEQQRQEAETALVGRRRAAAEHVVVVEPQLQIVADVDDADDAGRPLVQGAQASRAGPEVDERRAQRIGDDGGRARSRATSGRTRHAAGRDHVGGDDVADDGEQHAAADADRRHARRSRRRARRRSRRTCWRR